MYVYMYVHVYGTYGLWLAIFISVEGMFRKANIQIEISHGDTMEFVSVELAVRSGW